MNGTVRARQTPAQSREWAESQNGAAMSPLRFYEFARAEHAHRTKGRRRA